MRCHGARPAHDFAPCLLGWGHHYLSATNQEFERKLATYLRRWADQELHLPQSETFRPTWRGESPFRGLQAVDAEHEAIYFGRSEALSDLTRRIRAIEATAVTEPMVRLLLVKGMSGSGKTSLFKAALLPAPCCTGWRHETVTSKRPFAA